jgi:hypothetical protein
MRRIGVVVATVVGLVALGAAALGWLRSPDALTAVDAAELAADALTGAGVTGAVVGPEPAAGTYELGPGEVIRVWKAVATIEGGTILLWLAQEDGEPVFLDDRGPSGATQLLTEAQFGALADHDANPARDRQLRENVVVTVAAAAVLVVAALLATAGVSALR